VDSGSALATPDQFDASAREWVGAGDARVDTHMGIVGIVGGCCRVGPAHIRALRRALRGE